MEDNPVALIYICSHNNDFVDDRSALSSKTESNNSSFITPNAREK